MLPGRPWKKLLHFWYGNFLKKLLVLLNISFLPETTRASFGPHTTNPQVMIKSDESPITLYYIYSRVRSQHSCFVLFLYMYIYHNTQRHSRLVFRNCRCVESLLPILVFTRKHKNSRVVWSTRLFQHLLDRWFGFWGYGGRCRSALTLSLSLSYRGFLNFVEAAAVVAVVAVASPPAASAWSRLAFKGHHK